MLSSQKSFKSFCDFFPGIIHSHKLFIYMPLCSIYSRKKAKKPVISWRAFVYAVYPCRIYAVFLNFIFSTLSTELSTEKVVETPENPGFSEKSVDNFAENARYPHFETHFDFAFSTALSNDFPLEKMKIK